jgi:hypothetical protein
LPFFHFNLLRLKYLRNWLQLRRSGDGSEFCVVFKTVEGTDSATYTCNVAMTSVAIRSSPPTPADKDSEADKDAAEAPAVDAEDPPYDEKTCLPKARCLKALAELRRSRWFSSMALCLPSCVECIRIVKVTLPKISKNFQKFPKISKNFQKFPKISKNYQKLPKITKNFK